MHLLAGEFYHIYNRGNNRQPVFFNESNYLFFIKKMTEQLVPVSDIICYCLMPNHFHMMIRATEESIKTRPSFGGKAMQEFPYRVGILLSSYSQAINKQNNTTGSLFQQKTKAKILSAQVKGKKVNYLESCFFYIHNNPVKAKLVTSLKEWKFSSWLDYSGIRSGTICNMDIFFSCSGLTERDIASKLDKGFTEEDLKKFY